jgi:hypothetical protein
MEWLQRLRAGETEAQVATSARVQARTVRKHIALARADADQESIRRDILRRAIEDHQREDLLHTATALLHGLSQQLQGNGLGDPRRVSVTGKAALALLSHTKGTALPRLMRAWEGIVAEWDETVALLDRELADDTTRNGLAADGAVAALFQTGVLPYARSGRLEGLDSGWWKPVTNAELWFGARRVAEVGDSDRKAALAKRQFEVAHASLPDRALVGALRSAHVRAASVRQDLVDHLEDICMRRYFDGQCRWCPGVRGGQRPRQRVKGPSRS